MATPNPPSIPDGISSPVTRTPWMSWDGCCPGRCQFAHQQDWHCCWGSGLSTGKKRFSWMQPSHVLARRGKRRSCSQAAVGHSSSRLKLSIIRHSSYMHVSCMETPGKVFPWQFSLLLLHPHKPSPWVCSWSYPNFRGEDGSPHPWPRCLHGAFPRASLCFTRCKAAVGEKAAAA